MFVPKVIVNDPNFSTKTFILFPKQHKIGKLNKLQFDGDENEDETLMIMTMTSWDMTSEDSRIVAAFH